MLVPVGIAALQQYNVMAYKLARPCFGSFAIGEA